MIRFDIKKVITIFVDRFNFILNESYLIWKFGDEGDKRPPHFQNSSKKSYFTSIASD